MIKHKENCCCFKCNPFQNKRAVSNSVLKRKGNKFSEERKKEMSDFALKIGRKPPSNKGKTYEELYGKEKSDLLKEKRKIAMIERNPASWMLGRKMSEKTLMNYRNVRLGSKSHLWRGGLTEENKLARKSLMYRNWRKAVFERDDYTCQECHQRGGKLDPDHIKPFAHFKELRYELSNGRTLCHECHKKTDTYGSKSRVYATQKSIPS